MNVYLAAHYGSRKTMLEWADKLVEIGHSVISQWIDLTTDPESWSPLDQQRYAVQCRLDVQLADVLVMLPGADPVLLGLAVAGGAQVLLIGLHDMGSPFMKLPEVRSFGYLDRAFRDYFMTFRGLGQMDPHVRRARTLARQPLTRAIEKEE